MSKAWIMADTKQWANVLTEISKETEKIMDDGPKDALEKGAFAAFVATLRETTNLMFPYLPEGEREGILIACATWLDLGMIFGRAPALLVEILERTGVSIGVLVKEKEGGSDA